MNHLGKSWKSVCLARHPHAFKPAETCGENLTLYQIIPLLTTPWKKAFENTVRKGENDGNCHFFLYPQHFLPSWEQISNFDQILIHIYFTVCKCFQFRRVQNFSFGKEVTDSENFTQSSYDPKSLLVSREKTQSHCMQSSVQFSTNHHRIEILLYACHQVEFQEDELQLAHLQIGDLQNDLIG